MILWGIAKIMKECLHIYRHIMMIKHIIPMYICTGDSINISTWPLCDTFVFNYICGFDPHMWIFRMSRGYIFGISAIQFHAKICNLMLLAIFSSHRDVCRRCGRYASSRRDVCYICGCYSIGLRPSVCPILWVTACGKPIGETAGPFLYRYTLG